MLSLASRSPSEDARKRLAALGVTGNLDRRIEQGRAELVAMRTRKLNATGKGTGDFFALVSPAKNEQVKFVNGDAEIKALTDAVKSTNLDFKFPGPSSVRELRRGTVTCGMLPPAPAPNGKPGGKKGTKGNDPAATAEPAAQSEPFPGPCSIALLFSDSVPPSTRNVEFPSAERKSCIRACKHPRNWETLGLISDGGGNGRGSRIRSESSSGFRRRTNRRWRSAAPSTSTSRCATRHFLESSGRTHSPAA